MGACFEAPATSAPGRVASSPARSPAETTVAPSPTAAVPPAAYLLTPAQVGIPPAGGREHLGYLEAASLEPNQAAALELYQTFDWRDAATRSFAGGGSRVEQIVLISLDRAGARRAFSYWRSPAGGQNSVQISCPPASGLDQCAASRTGANGAAAGRRGLLVFQLTTQGVPLEPLLAASAALISGGPPA